MISFVLWVEEAVVVERSLPNGPSPSRQVEAGSPIWVTQERFPLVNVVVLEV